MVCVDVWRLVDICKSLSREYEGLQIADRRHRGYTSDFGSCCHEGEWGRGWSVRLEAATFLRVLGELLHSTARTGEV